MLRAKEAREVVERTIEEKVARLTERANKKCEVLSEEILKRAKMCSTELVTTVDSDIRAYVIAELQDNGYSVRLHPADNTITIQW